MELKVLYGGLPREQCKLIERLINESTKHLVGSNLGQKVTRVALKRMLRDSTVSVVLLNESDYDQMKTSLSDDRLVCVINEDSIINLFESRYGVNQEEPDEKDSDEEDEVIDRGYENKDRGNVVEEEDDTKLEEDSDLETDEPNRELTWEEILANYEKLGKEDLEDTDDTSEESVGESIEDENKSKTTGSIDNITDNKDDIDSELESDQIPQLDDEDSSSNRGIVDNGVGNGEVSQDQPSNSALHILINNLQAQIKEQQEFIDNSVSREDYQSLKQKYTQAESKLETLIKEKDLLVSQADELIDDKKRLSSELEKLKQESKSSMERVIQLDSERKALESRVLDAEKGKSDLEERLSLVTMERDNLTSQMDDIKLKFSDLLFQVERQKKTINELKAGKAPVIRPIKRRYPNVEFIVPLSSNSVMVMYEYLSSRTDDFLFVDLTNNSYIDSYIKMNSLVKPSKWLVDGYNYKKVIAGSKSHTNIRVISHVIHAMDRGILLQLDWDKVLGDLSLEKKVLINIGCIYDEHVVDVLKAVQSGVTIKGFLGDMKRDQRIGKFRLSDLNKVRVIAKRGVEDAFKIITDRY